MKNGRLAAQALLAEWLAADLRKQEHPEQSSEMNLGTATISRQSLILDNQAVAAGGSDMATVGRSVGCARCGAKTRRAGTCQGAGDEEWPLQDARRAQYWPAHARRSRAQTATYCSPGLKNKDALEDIKGGVMGPRGYVPATAGRCRVKG